MDADFPAAHSMDSSWYAVDRHGRVALFHTGAGGAVAEGAYCPEMAAELADLDPEDLEAMGIDPASVVDAPANQVPDESRVFVYETGPLDEALADCYQRQQAPEQPLHVDELPPQVREAIGRVRFDTLDFSKANVFQPVELTACATWDPAYLAGDGKTVKAVPGREDEYAQFYQQYRNDFADGELVLEEPPKRR